MKILNVLFDLVLALTIFVFITNSIVVNTTSRYLYDDINQVPYKEYTLVLGTSKNGKAGINPYFKYRMEAAALLYQKGKTEKIIVSGDNHIKTYNETEDMHDYLVQLGVPSKAIIKDYAGFRTLDSVLRAKKVFQCQSLIIVSQKFHNQRAVFIAKNHEMDVVAYNAEDVGGGKTLTHFRELFAKTLVLIDLYILNRGPKFL